MTEELKYLIEERENCHKEIKGQWSRIKQLNKMVKEICTHETLQIKWQNWKEFYECTVCKKRFKSNDPNLKDHILVDYKGEIIQEND